MTQAKHWTVGIYVDEHDEAVPASLRDTAS